MKYRTSENTPLEVYHGVPDGWSKSDVINEHKKLGGVVSIDGPDATEPGSPPWFPCRFEWLQYRETIRRICDGVSAGDKACIELAIRYIELDYLGSYSGFLRARLSRLLRKQELSPNQRLRLMSHICNLFQRKQFLNEAREYNKLLKRIKSQTTEPNK